MFSVCREGWQSGGVKCQFRLDFGQIIYSLWALVSWKWEYWLNIVNIKLADLSYCVQFCNLGFDGLFGEYLSMSVHMSSGHSLWTWHRVPGVAVSPYWIIPLLLHKCAFLFREDYILLGDEGILWEETDVWVSLKEASGFGRHGWAEDITGWRRKRQGFSYSSSEYLLTAYYD